MFMKLGININNKIYSINVKNLVSKIKNVSLEAKTFSNKIPTKSKTTFIAASILAASLGITINRCTAENNQDNIEIVDKSESDFFKYVDIVPETTYTVVSGDNLSKIADLHNVSLLRLKAAHRLYSWVNSLKDISLISCFLI